jgi:hypothetical protein
LPSIARRLALLGTLVVLGCRETVGPLSGDGGTFVLRSLDAKPVPVLQYESTKLRQYLAADTMAFDGRSSVATITVVRIDSVGVAYTEVQRYPGTMEYRIRGDTIDFHYDCPPYALCASPPIGWREADGSLVVAYRSGKAWSNVKRYEQVQ